MSSDLVTIDIKNGIADVRLNREEKYNALSQDMLTPLSRRAIRHRQMMFSGVVRQRTWVLCGLDMASRLHVRWP